MGRATLTALAVERAHRSGEPVLLSDGDGLYLRKQSRDGASWTHRYRFAGREHWLTLGHYPDISLAEARIEARLARVLLDKQQDPLSVRRAAEAEQRQRGSFCELCEAWYRYEITGRALKHPDVPRRHLDKYLLPKLGRTAAADVTPADIARVIDELKGRAPTAANHLLRFTRRIFAFGVRRRMVLRGVEGIYDRHDYFKERRAALEQCTVVLLEAERGGSKIISSRRAQGGAAGIKCASADRGRL